MRPRPQRAARHRRTSELVRNVLFIAAVILWALVLMRVFSLAASSGTSGTGGSPVPAYYYYQQPTQQLRAVQQNPGAG